MSFAARNALLADASDDILVREAGVVQRVRQRAAVGLRHDRLLKIDEVDSEQEQNGEFGERQAIAGNKSARSKAIRRMSSTP